MLDVCAVQVFPRRKTLTKLFYVAMFAYFREGAQRKFEAAFSFPVGRLKEFETAAKNITQEKTE